MREDSNPRLDIYNYIKFVVKIVWIPYPLKNGGFVEWP